MSSSFSFKKIDVVSSVVKNLNNQDVRFYDLISQSFLLNTKKEIRGKLISYEVLEDGDEIFIGFIQSEVTKNIPPKLNGSTNTIEALDLNDEDSLVYGNIFLYDKKNDFLFYEINVNSIYLDGFAEFLHSFNSLNIIDKYEVKFSTIYRKNQYAKALDMDIYKRFKMLIRQPSKFIQDMSLINTSDLNNQINLEFSNDITRAAEFNSDSAEIIFCVDRPKTKGGLAKDLMHRFITDFNDKIVQSNLESYVTKVEVVGYTEESDKSLTKLNLLGDIYFLRIKLEVFRVGYDLQKSERKDRIIELYNNNILELKSYI